MPTDEHRTVIEECSRVLRPGGLLLCSIGETAWEGTNPNWLDSGVEMTWSFPGIARTDEYLEGSNFDVVRRWDVEDELGDGRFPFVLARSTGR